MTLIRELISIPERVHQGDFVLKLSEGVRAAEETLGTYVVTPQLDQAFDSALEFIKSALMTRQSKAAYLHGSFGSGKSHFMAVLNLLLAGNTRARAIRELAGTIARHNEWTQGRKFLLVPYHMIGARTLESAILGGYADHVRALHPEAPIPGFYLAEGLFRDAQQLRTRMGDEAFFARMNEQAGGGGGGWGDLAAGWDAASFEAAMLEAPRGDERTRLVGDLIACFFTAYGSVARSGAGGRDEAFVSLDDGLAILSRHASALGYDAVILFLDELILWLASRAADVAFVSSEGAKLSKLVEAANADRPVPLVSFVARQRDLRELVGDNMAGAMQMQFADVLKYWEARFHRITLEDRNLPAIAQARVLKPQSEAARQVLDGAFDDFTARYRAVLDTLLTTSADRDMFRQVYPFSPALVQTLVAVSSVLQRERTALRLMLQLLVDRRDDLELGQIIPVGDLWDAIAEGDEPFSDAMRLHFDNAKRLYRQKLVPMLARIHGVEAEAAQAGTAEPQRQRAFRNDARILKTLLLAALVPEVEAIKALTAQRLAALNHGSVRSPIAGREAQDVLKKCKEWAAEVGEIKVVEGQNPVIAIQVTGIDIEPVVKGADVHDNPGNRRRKIRELLFAELGIPDTNELFTHFAFWWRGTLRDVEVVYENVRELADDRLRGRDGATTVILDFPFDEPNRTPADDIARLDRYEGDGAQTLVWLPSFLSDKAMKDLGRLVVLDYLLTGERFNEYSTHLSQVDRAQARSLARNQRDMLMQRMKQALEVAYGIATEPQDAVDQRLPTGDQFRTLDRTFEPRAPVGANLREGFADLLDQLFTHRHPAHPRFETEVKLPVLRKVEAELVRALEDKDQRVHVPDKAVRQITRSVVNPLRLANMGDTHLALETHWRSHFLQRQAADGDDLPLTVARLRRWIDEPVPMGLPVEVQNLIIQTFAAQTNRSFFLKNGPYAPTLDATPDELELREQALPPEATWRAAVKRAGQFFGLTVAESLNAGNVARLEEMLRAEAGRRVAWLQSFARSLAERWRDFGQDRGQADRIRTAEGAAALLAAMAAPNADALRVLAESAVATTETAYGQTIGRAQALDDAMKQADWDLFSAVVVLVDHRRPAAEAMRERLAEILGSDEHAIGLRAALNEQKVKALKLLTEAPPPPAPPPAPPGPPPDAPKPGVRLVREGARNDLPADQAIASLEEIRTELEKDRDYRLSISWKITRKE